ncbi:MAG TPA: NB-ARC domain-containing protein [Roseiflexaceae bacterium]|nr:NB-ARC domain-containing protein [Roseiflexaceae bacterium]
MSKNTQFGRLLKAGISSIANKEGVIAPLVEDDLGQQIGVAGNTIQRYKAGYLPPEPRSVKILAQVCVQRGLMGKPWLEQFLRAAGYPHPEALVGELFPLPPGLRSEQQRVYQNLPAPTYSHFVMRPQAFEDVLDGLRQRSAVVLIASMGGMGKTSLAREVASRCLSGDAAELEFDAAVWVSDKDQPGTVNLSTVLDEVARTLDYPGLTQYAHTEKRFEVEQLLRRQSVLLVVDNFETITDGALLDWLVRIPEPSKVVITTREHHRAFRGAWSIELGGMTNDEARLLINDRLRMLKWDARAVDPAQLTPLIVATGGNPKAIELALGVIKYERRPLSLVLQELERARLALFDDLFARAWLLLDEPARQLLLALTFFPTSADREALAKTAGLSTDSCLRAAERLGELALVDMQGPNPLEPERYSLHPLVRAFARARLAETPSFEAVARTRWVAWYRALAARVGFCWHNLALLDLLDNEHETLHAAIEWTFGQGRDADAIALIEGVRYYDTVRGLWKQLTINLLRAEAARRLGDPAEEAMGLAYHIAICCKQGLFDEAATYLAQLEHVAQGAKLPAPVRFEIGYARSVYVQGRNDPAMAEQSWRALLPLAQELDAQKYVIVRRWLAICRAEQGDRVGARRLFRESLDDAVRSGDQRTVMGNTLKLAAMDLEDGDLPAAAAGLERAIASAERYGDRRRLAEAHLLRGHLLARRGDAAGAHQALAEAIDLSERLGMRRLLEEARQGQKQL